MLRVALSARRLQPRPAVLSAARLAGGAWGLPPACCRHGRSARSSLLAKLKSTRKPRIIAELEDELRPLRDNNEWELLLTAEIRAGRRERVFGLMDEMRGEGFAPRRDAYNRLIAACAKHGEWESADWLLGEMGRVGVAPSVETYNRLLAACRGDGQWEAALSLMEEMVAMGLEPDPKSYEAAVAACENGGEWARAMELLEQAGHLQRRINARSKRHYFD
eukprot:2921867-Prymnesium_polylepis.1